MAPANTLSYHVNGPVVPNCNVGSAGAYVAVGVCQDGADIDITPLHHPIKSDGGGGPEGAQVEVVQLNAMVTIRFRLVPFAGTYVNKLRAAAVGSAVDGTLPVPGTLLGLGGFLVGLYLPYGGAADVDGPWWFPQCEVVRPGSNRVSTKETTPDWEFRSFVYFNPASFVSVAGLPLYTRTAPV